MSGRRQSVPVTGKREPEAKFVVRLPQASLRMLKELARVHERSATAEVRLALEAHIASAMLDALDDPEFVAMVQAGHPGVDLTDVRKRAELDAVVFRDAALARPGATLTVARALEAAS